MKKISVFAIVVTMVAFVCNLTFTSCGNNKPIPPKNDTTSSGGGTGTDKTPFLGAWTVDSVMSKFNDTTIINKTDEFRGMNPNAFKPKSLIIYQDSLSLDIQGVGKFSNTYTVRDNILTVINPYNQVYTATVATDQWDGERFLYLVYSNSVTSQDYLVMHYEH